MIEWLQGTLVAVSGLILLVLLAREPVRRQFGSRITYGLWLIPLGRLLMPTLTERVERVSPSTPDTAAFAQAHVAHFGVVGLALTATWLAGGAALLLVRVAQYRRQRSAILSGAIDIGQAGSIRLVRSRAVHGPVAFGILDRVIAVPSDFDARFSEEERRLALEHEFTHHCSGDLIANAVAVILLSVQWFNPLAWAAHAAFRLDQEAACDARLLDKGGNRSDYGRAIAKAASGKTYLLAAALGRRSTLHRRLNYMLGTSTARQRLVGRILVTTAVALAAPLTASHAISYADVTRLSPTAQKFDENRPGLAVVQRAAPAHRPTGTDLAAIEPATNGATASQLEADQRKRNAEKSEARHEQAKRDAELAERKEDQAKRDAEQSEHARDRVKVNAEQADRAEDQAKRAAEGEQRDHGNAQPTADQVPTNPQ